MKARITVLNNYYTAEDSFALAQHYRGDDGDGHPDEISEPVDESHHSWEDIDTGDWILVCDGAVKYIGSWTANPLIVHDE